MLPIVIGLIGFKQLNKPFRFLLYFFIFSGIVEIQASVFKSIISNNMPGLHLFTVVEFMAFSFTYYAYLSKHKNLKLIIPVNFLIFIALAFFDVFYLNGIWQPNTLSRTYASFSMVIYASVFFYYMLKEDLSYYSWQYPMFWISIGVLLYFSVNIFYFMMIRYLTANAVSVGRLGLYTHGFINLVANILYAQSYRCIQKQQIQ